MGGREGGMAEYNNFQQLVYLFLLTLKRSSWDASFLAWKKEGKCFNNGNDDDDEEDDGNNDSCGGDDDVDDSDEDNDDGDEDEDEDEDDDNNRMHYRTTALETTFEVCQI